MACIIDSSDMALTYDSEANGLLDKVTKMWCVVCEDYETGIMYLFHDFPEYDNYSGVDDEGNEFTLPARNGTLTDGVKFLHRARSLICHNQLGYDQFLMKKFFPKFKIRYNYPEIRDTLLESQVLWYDRKPVKGYKGIHGLAVWGARLGIRKPEIEDWSFMDAAKLHRCLEDVKINTAVAKQLDAEKQWLYTNCNGISFDDALKIEHEYRYWSTIQELNGAQVDAEHMEKCCVELDDLIETLRAEIEPMLPPSINVKSARESAHEVAKLLGAKKVPPEKKVWKKRKGEDYVTVVKTMYRPTMKVFKINKQKMYAVVIEGKEVKGHEFPKAKEAREWAKENYPGVKGIKYPWIEIETPEYDRHTKNHFGEQLEGDKAPEIIGPYTKIEFEKSKMSQHEKVKLLLVTLGWQTDEWTFKKDSDGQFERADESGEVVWPAKPIQGKQLREKYKAGERIPATPKITEDSFQWLPEGLGQKIKEYNTYSHRRKFIQNPTDDTKGLLNNIRPDGRVSCGLMTFGTTAGRAAQYGWVNAPSVQALYGENIRKIIVAPTGSKLIGIDMPSAHPRLLADFTQNETFIKAVDGKEEDEDGNYIGEDFHTVNSILFKLNSEGDVEHCRRTQLHDGIREAVDAGRKKGKGGSYCTLYGGSDKKLALTLGIQESLGAELKESFLSGLGLDLLLEEVSSTWKAQKRDKGSYITVLGGYHAWSNSKHKIINFKALGSEAVVQKVAVNLLCRKFRDMNLKSKLILNIHDEVLLEVPDDEVEIVKPIAAKMYVDAALQLGLTLDWTSTAKVGENYAVCH